MVGRSEVSWLILIIQYSSSVVTMQMLHMGLIVVCVSENPLPLTCHICWGLDRPFFASPLACWKPHVGIATARHKACCLLILARRVSSLLPPLGQKQRMPIIWAATWCKREKGKSSLRIHRCDQIIYLGFFQSWQTTHTLLPGALRRQIEYDCNLLLAPPWTLTACVLNWGWIPRPCRCQQIAFFLLTFKAARVSRNCIIPWLAV